MRRTIRINLAAAAAFAALFGIMPLAHAGHLGNGAQQRIQVAVNNCMKMPHDKMVADQYCKSLMVQHPEMFASK